MVKNTMKMTKVLSANNQNLFDIKFFKINTEVPIIKSSKAKTPIRG